MQTVSAFRVTLISSPLPESQQYQLTLPPRHRNEWDKYLPHKCWPNIPWYKANKLLSLITKESSISDWPLVMNTSNTVISYKRNNNERLTVKKGIFLLMKEPVWMFVYQVWYGIFQINMTHTYYKKNWHLSTFVKQNRKLIPNFMNFQ